MMDYDPKAERATRDVVSRAIYHEMREGRTTPNGRRLHRYRCLIWGPSDRRRKIQGHGRRCADCGFDLAGRSVEVVPTAHYLMGGVVVDEDTRTEMPGLYVAGEDAGGAHGANRLGGNGVANSTVFGGIAGSKSMAADAGALTFRDPDEGGLLRDRGRSLPACRFRRSRATAVHPLRNRLMDVMWDHVGVMRDASGVERGLEEVGTIRDDLMTVGVDDSNLAFNLTWHDWLNLQSLVEMSEVIGRAAIARDNSRGAHYREDFPEAGDLEKALTSRSCAKMVMTLASSEKLSRSRMCGRARRS